MAKSEVNTPAKINIGLFVTQKRQDGFHNIETIFYPVSLYDKIIVEDSDTFYFSANVKSLPDNSTNLIIHAKNLLEEYSGERLNIKIHLWKNIPIGAGLGGGSSDAAAVLNLLNEFAGLNLSSNELFDIGLRLGSDVPFFLNPRPSYACGKGEILSPQMLHLDLPLVIVNPGINISTKWAYKHIKPGGTIFDLRKIESLDLYHLKLYSEKILNVFETPVFEMYPAIKKIKILHYKLGAVFSLMSGSGSSVFGIYPDTGSAASAAKIMKEQGYFVFTQDSKLF
ncbi:MAG TPA: 4-(cytidine 5'-diphospho)-2-C-methyl-D-erythritol kinase [Ignavibacteriaceae bacterium]|jgi:4-diphosphocytidyl-2-C-methyl-D-erythritol kinase|nr:4-(cytidine 5'-diphospho)-2-C-methyl-D-erythritol kinase [Ignavibacteriaceae bacterium]